DSGSGGDGGGGSGSDSGSGGDGGSGSGSSSGPGDPPPNNPPIAVDDSRATSYKTPVSIDVLYDWIYNGVHYGDHDPDGDAIDIQSAQNGQHGTVKIMRPGDEGYNSYATLPYNRAYVIYTPDAGFFSEDTFEYTIEDDDGATDTATVTVDVNLSLSLSLDAGDVPTGDAPWSYIDARVAYGTDQDGNPLFVDDGTTIEWRFEGVGGSLETDQTTTADGFSTNVLNTTTAAGDTFRVFAKVTKAAIDGGSVLPYEGSEILATVTVQPGKAADIRFEVDDNRLPSDGNSQTRITLTARDAAGNLVADGTEIEWGLAGSGTLLDADTTTVDGRASVTLRSGIYPETQSVSATIDGYKASTEVESLRLNIRLGITGNVLTLGNNESAIVTATVTDADGQPVADGTPITWHTAKGTISGDSAVYGGVAQATLSALGGSQIPGTGYVRAFVGSNSGKAGYLWVAPASALSVQGARYVIAGDATTDGTYPIEQADGSLRYYDYHASAEFTITGTPNATVEVWTDDPNVLNPGGDLLIARNSAGETGKMVTVQLNDQGQGKVWIQSQGVLNPNMGIVVPIAVRERGLFGYNAETSFNIAVQPKRVIAGTLDFVGKLGWGAIAGEGNSAEEIAGDLAFSMIPVVGVYSDIRDMGKELAKLWPGGESPNWVTFGFAAAGVVGEFFGPGDLVFDIGKQLAKVVAMTAPVWLYFLKFAKEANLSKLEEAADLLRKYVADADFRRIVDGGLDPNPGRLVDNVEDTDKLVKVVKGLDPDTAADMFKRVADDPIAARRVLDVLSDVSPDTLAILKQSPDKLDVVIDGVTAKRTLGFDPWDKGIVEQYASSERGIWGLSWKLRGEAIERRIGHNVPPGFEDIDVWDKTTGVATSIKSADLTGSSYQSGDILGALKRVTHFDELVAFEGAARKNRTTAEELVIKSSEIKQKVLHFAISPEPLTSAQQQAIQDFIDLGQQKGITIIIDPVQF
ncbi:MAG: hypothetical protein IRY99_12345, partial [Isosphaeraceae bacterium]|nr:hypothetical protein [Isosphaeraceae bacterium]